jgi:hypothetical protein
MAERVWIDNQVCFLERQEIHSKLIATLETHWIDLRGDRPMPRRDEIDPLNFVSLLSYISIVELHYDPFRVRYRLVGTEVARIVGENFSNRWLDDTGWGDAAIALNRLLYQRVAQTKIPQFGLSTCEWQGKPDHVFEWALFPLSSGGEVVTHVLSIDDYTVISPRSLLLPIG